ncbi:MAG: DUF1730 domain-containing protein [Ruminobacter sp.]|uniref:epoxyqueuosine reductase n=1 Tax=Ruminobacter sp. TaxID=2774296 RepID=UPI001B6C486C|nr:QueG-associated DUF1730 domain-containing protein [Ruminobacter sp.]MBP3748264.1 DUF1730 domain-containing protein [Ruminobacter sp.]
MHALSDELPELSADFWLKLKHKCNELQIISLHIIPTGYAIGGKKSFDEKFGTDIPADLEYLSRNREVRDNPSLILEGARSVISISLSYRNLDYNADPHYGCISAYARGRDYHKVMKQRLERLGEWLRDIFPDIRYRAITDSAPFYEQHFAAASSFMVKGRNNLIRHRDAGSMIFLGELLVDMNLNADGRIITLNLTPESSDGNLLTFTGINPVTGETEEADNPPSPAIACPDKCHRCLDACPTGALNPQKFIVSKCISYLTIEYGGYIPDELWEKIGNRIYGCDTCQLTCPFNRKVSVAADREFADRFGKDFLKLTGLLSLTPEKFRESFAGTPILRIGFCKMMRNCVIAAANTGSKIYLPYLIIQRNSVMKKLNLLRSQVALSAESPDGGSQDLSADSAEERRTLREIRECEMVIQHITRAVKLLSGSF